MKSNSLHCITCGAPLETTLHQLNCTVCNAAFPLQSGIPIFGNADEVAEWTSYHTELGKTGEVAGGNYLSEQPSNENSFYSRFLPDNAREVLDAGGGDGNTTAEWAARHPHATVKVMDLSIHGLKKVLKRNIPNMHPICAPADRRFPFDAASFDTISTVFLVEHMVPDALNRFLAEAFRCLKPGGKLVVASDTAFYDAVLHPLERLIKTGKYIANDPTHINLMTPGQCEAIVAQHGFQLSGRTIHWIAGRHKLAQYFYRLIPNRLAEALFSTMYVIEAQKPL